MRFFILLALAVAIVAMAPAILRIIPTELTVPDLSGPSRTEQEQQQRQQQQRQQQQQQQQGSDRATSAAESIAEKLRALPTKYNRPETLSLGESSPVELVIQTDKLQPINELLKGFPGEIRTAVVRVGPLASAYLTGPEDRVKITLRGDPIRAVTKDAPVTWIWDVRPLKPGDVQVVLEVFTHVKPGKDEGRVQMRVLQDTWTVHATAFEWAKYYVSEIEPIRAFLFAIIAGMFATLGYFGFKGWKGANPSADES